MWSDLYTLLCSIYILHYMPPQQMYLHPLMVVCQWWQWMKQARSASLGADQHWDLVKWSLVTLCSTGEGDPPLTPLAQCLALVQPHTPSPTSLLVQCMKWELQQEVILDWVDTAVGVGSRLRLTTVSVHCTRRHCECMRLQDPTRCIDIKFCIHLTALLYIFNCKKVWL